MYLFNRNKGINQSLHLTGRGKHLFLLSYLTVVILKAHPFSAERVEASERDLADIELKEQTPSLLDVASETLSFSSAEAPEAEVSLPVQPLPVFEPVTNLTDEELLEEPAIYASAVAASSAQAPTVTIPVSDLMTTNFELKDETIYWKHELNAGFVNREDMTWFFNVPASVSEPTNWEILRYDPQGQLIERLTEWSQTPPPSDMSYETIDFVSGRPYDSKDLSILQMLETVDFKGYRQVLASAQPLHYLLKVKNYQAATNRWVVTYQTKVLDKTKTPDYLVGLDSTDHQEPKQLKRILVDYGKNLFPDLSKPEQPKVWPVYAGDHSISGRTNPYFLVTVTTEQDSYLAKSDSAGHFRVGIPQAQANAAFTVQVANVLGVPSNPLKLTVGVPTGTTPAIQTTGDSPGQGILTAKVTTSVSPSLQEVEAAVEALPSSASLTIEADPQTLPVEPITIASVVQQVKSLVKGLVSNLTPRPEEENAPKPLSIDEKGKITIKPIPGATRMKVTYRTKSGKKKTVTIRQTAKGDWVTSDKTMEVDRETGQMHLLAGELSPASKVTVEMIDQTNSPLQKEAIEVPALPALPKLLPYKGDVLILPPEDAVELLLSYRDKIGYVHVIEAYKNSQTKNWESSSNAIFLSSGVSLIIIPNRSLGEDADVVVSTRNAAGFYSEEWAERTSAILAKSELETEEHLEQYFQSQD